MIEGKVDIFLSIREPDKNLLWLRPYLDKDGYELLYFGVEGWTPLICGHCPYIKPKVPPMKPDNTESIIINKDILLEIPDRAIEGIEGQIYEINSPNYKSSSIQKPSCGCPDETIK